MIRRLHVKNFRCLHDFELNLAGRHSNLLIGKNGSGKSAVRDTIRLLQQIGRGVNKCNELVWLYDFVGDNRVGPRIEVEAQINGIAYVYVVGFEISEKTKVFALAEESLTAGGDKVFERLPDQVHIWRGNAITGFLFSPALVTLPILPSERGDALDAFKTWLQSIVIVSPIPSLITGESDGDIVDPDLEVREFGHWFTKLTTEWPTSYSVMSSYLVGVMPDFQAIQNLPTGYPSRRLEVLFDSDRQTLRIPFRSLSDGEKCQMIAALVLASNQVDRPIVCFWDEPDNYLSISEVGHFVMALRRAFEKHGQFIATSHNPEAIRAFSDENTILLYRNNHLETTKAKVLSDIEVHGDLVEALIRGDVEP